MADYNSIGGLSDAEMERARKLKGEIQSDVVTESISIKDAVVWAIDNELERRESEQ